MQREAETYAAEDARKREEIETRNMADNLAYTAEKMLREQGDKVPGELKTEVEGKIAAVKSALSGSDAEQIKRASQELSETLQKVGTAVYEQAGAEQPPPAGEEPGGKDEGTVEGEFREL